MELPGTPARLYLLSVAMALAVGGAVANLPVTFKSSMCYDPYGDANVQLKCPMGYAIETLAAFTGISRGNACSYQAWDCVLHDSATAQCNHKALCSITTSYSQQEQHQHKLTCGHTGTSLYFQTEYRCLTENGHLATLEDVQSTPLAKPPLATSGQTEHSKQGETAEKPKSITDDKYTLIAIVCGTVVSLGVVIGITVGLAHRIKSRNYGQPVVYGQRSPRSLVEEDTNQTHSSNFTMQARTNASQNYSEREAQLYLDSDASS